jgi:putative membrane protein
MFCEPGWNGGWLFSGWIMPGVLLLNDNWLCGPGAYFHGPWGMLVNLGFWILVIFLLVWLFKAIFKKSAALPASSSLEVLRHRYAAGEIDRQEYERMKQELE